MTHPIAIHDGTGWEPVSIAKQYAGQWITVLGGGGSPAPPELTPDDGPVLNVASNCGVLQNEWTPGSTGAGTGTRHLLYANAASLTIGWYARSNPGFGVTAPTPLRAWWRRLGGAWTAVAFGGDPEVTLTPSLDATDATAMQDVYADPIPGPWYAGDELEVLTWGQADGGTFGVQGGVDGEYDLGIVPGDAAAMPGATSADFTGAGTGTRPSAILAPSAQASSWALIGDSNSVNPARSYLAIGFRSRQLPHIINGKHGLSTGHLVGDWWDFQLGEQVKYTDSIYSALLTNDGGAGLAGMQDLLLAVWAKARAAGITRWVQATKTPSYAVKEGGGTSGSPEPTTAINAWLRDGAPVTGGVAAPTGTTDPGAVRATVITWDFRVIPGDPAHPVGDGWIGDTTYVLETSLGSSTWKPEYDANDVNHYYDAAHEAQGAVLAEHLRLMGF